MSKNYDLYPASERKIDNWRRRILGYEKMKRDLQRQIQTLRNKNKKQKEVIDKAINNSQYWIDYYTRLNSDERIALRLQENIDILKEVSE